MTSERKGAWGLACAAPQHVEEQGPGVGSPLRARQYRAGMTPACEHKHCRPCLPADGT